MDDDRVVTVDRDSDGDVDVSDVAMEGENSGNDGAVKKGRGHNSRNEGGRRPAKDYRENAMSLVSKSKAKQPERSVEGWILLVRGVHEEAAESDVHDAFAEFGTVKNIHVNLNRRTGFVKGYALVEYEEREDAEEAIKEMNGEKLLGVEITCSWAFVQAPTGGGAANGRRGGGGGGRGGRGGRSGGGGGGGRSSSRDRRRR